jgi:hypothetical protein
VVAPLAKDGCVTSTVLECSPQLHGKKEVVDAVLIDDKR